VPALPSWLTTSLWDQFATLIPPRPVIDPAHSSGLSSAPDHTPTQRTRTKQRHTTRVRTPRGSAGRDSGTCVQSFFSCSRRALRARWPAVLLLDRHCATGMRPSAGPAARRSSRGEPRWGACREENEPARRGAGLRDGPGGAATGSELLRTAVIPSTTCGLSRWFVGAQSFSMRVTCRRGLHPDEPP